MEIKIAVETAGQQGGGALKALLAISLMAFSLGPSDP